MCTSSVDACGVLLWSCAFQIFWGCPLLMLQSNILLPHKRLKHTDWRLDVIRKTIFLVIQPAFQCCFPRVILYSLCLCNTLGPALLSRGPFACRVMRFEFADIWLAKYSLWTPQRDESPNTCYVASAQCHEVLYRSLSSLKLSTLCTLMQWGMSRSCTLACLRDHLASTARLIGCSSERWSCHPSSTSI